MMEWVVQTFGWIADGRLVLVQFMSGLANAMFLFLVASGLSLIFGVSRIVNFAHGSFYMLAAYLTYTFMSAFAATRWQFWLALLLAPALVAVLGGVIEVTLLRRIYRAPELYPLLLTFGLVLIVADAVRYLWGTENKTVSSPALLAGSVSLFGQPFPTYDLLVIALGPLVAVGLWYLFYRTRWGILIRAATHDREMVGILGVDQAKLFTSVFVFGSWLAGLGGALQAPRQALTTTMDTSIIVEAFVVVVVGGMGSFGGALLSALLIGEFEAFGILVLPRISLVLIFAFMAVVLVVRPWGLLGKPAAGVGDQPASPGLERGGPLPAWGWGVVGLALLALPLVVPRFYAKLAVEIFALALFASSLNLLMGTGGMVSFGHAAYFGLGAYSAGLLMQKAGAPMLLAFALAPLCTAVFALAFGFFCVRLTSIYFSMLTLAFAQVAYTVVFQWYGFTGGDNGIQGIWPSDLLASHVRYYYFALAVTAACLGLLYRITRSPFGYALRATRDSPRRSQAIGVNLRRHQLLAFVIAGLFSGVAGALFVFLKGSAVPDYLFVAKSIEPLVMILLGGIQHFAGPMVGAALFTGLEFLVTRWTDYWQVVLGGILTCLVVLFPRGVVVYARESWGRVRSAVGQ